MKKINKIQTFFISFFLVVLFSCNLNNKEEFVIDENYYLPVKIDDISHLINRVIYNALSLFPDSIEYGISPIFVDNIEREIRRFDYIIGKEGKREDDIFYDKKEVKQFRKDYKYLMGKSINSFISEIHKNKVSYETIELFVEVGPPFVDRKNSIVIIFCRLTHRNDFESDEFTKNESFFVHKVSLDGDSWELYGKKQIGLKVK